MNILFPMSIIVSCVIAFKLLGLATASQVTSYEFVSYILLATLLGLAVLEHCFLMLPVNDAILWKWSIKLPKTNPK
jgi:putative photosynthetic complex assembly protein 2